MTQERPCFSSAWWWPDRELKVCERHLSPGASLLLAPTSAVVRRSRSRPLSRAFPPLRILRLRTVTSDSQSVLDTCQLSLDLLWVLKSDKQNICLLRLLPSQVRDCESSKWKTWTSLELIGQLVAGVEVKSWCYFGGDRLNTLVEGVFEEQVIRRFDEYCQVPAICHNKEMARIQSWAIEQ